MNVCISLEMAFVATVLTACGIETGFPQGRPLSVYLTVATVLTACGIETKKEITAKIENQLQQYLPLAVLKLNKLIICFTR